MSQSKYIEDNGAISFNGFLGVFPLDNKSVAKALNEMNYLCEGYERRIRKQSEQIKMLRDAINLANTKLCDVSNSFYGQNLSVAGWHLNGAHEPIDSWFEQNDWEPVELSVLTEEAE